MWVNSFQMPGSLRLSVAGGAGARLGHAFQSGVLLCQLVEATAPNVPLNGVNTRPRARAACINNLEKALRVIYNHTKVRQAKVPSAGDIYDQKEERIAILLAEMLEAQVIRRW